MTATTTNSDQGVGVLILGRIALLPADVPLQAVAIKSMQMPKESVKRVLKALWTQAKETRGLPGSLPIVLMRVGKEGARCVAVDKVKKFWKEQPLSVDVQSLGAGVTMGVIEAGCLVPLSKLAAERLSKQNKGYWTQISEMVRQRGMRALYDGGTSHAIGRFLAWPIFFLTQKYATDVMAKIAPASQYPKLNNIGTASAIAFNLTVLAVPLNFIQTHTQIHPELQKQSFRQICKTLLTKYKWRLFIRGAFPTWAAKFLTSLWFNHMLPQSPSSSPRLTEKGL